MLVVDRTIDRVANISVIVGIIGNVLCSMVYDFYQIKGYWYVGNALAFVCYGYAINRLMPNTTSKILLAVVLSQFLDEWLGDPTKANLIEYVAFFGILFYFWINREKQSKGV